MAPCVGHQSQEHSQAEGEDEGVVLVRTPCRLLNTHFLPRLRRPYPDVQCVSGTVEVGTLPSKLQRTWADHRAPTLSVLYMGFWVPREIFMVLVLNMH